MQQSLDGGATDAIAAHKLAFTHPAGKLFRQAVFRDLEVNIVLDRLEIDVGRFIMMGRRGDKKPPDGIAGQDFRLAKQTQSRLYRRARNSEDIRELLSRQRVSGRQALSLNVIKDA